jgi:hypothetical protein
MLDGLDDQDESVRIAVRALGDMRSGATMSSPNCMNFGIPHYFILIIL